MRMRVGPQSLIHLDQAEYHIISAVAQKVPGEHRTHLEQLYRGTYQFKEPPNA